MTPSARSAVDAALGAVEEVVARRAARLTVREVGQVVAIDEGVVRVSGLPDVRAEEVVTFADGRLGLALNLDPDEVGVVLLDPPEGIDAGDTVLRTHRIMDVPVGDALLGRVIDPTGRPLDDAGPVRTAERWPIERPAPAIRDRAPVTTPLQTGIKVVDALFPIGRGQRELILGDRQTGKSAIALDTVLNQRDSGVVSVYCVIGQRSAAVARLVADLRRHDALERTTVVVTTADAPPGLQFAAPYAATSIAERFMADGRDVLIVYDDLTAHARAYRELSLLLRRPPGREAFPGDIFYVHSRLLERATHLADELGGGSLTALPIIETEAQDVAAYIPTNLISITDGQLYVTPTLFRQGQLPAVDVGLSVSRVGGKAQLPAYRAVVADLRLSYAQFEELERFSRYGARLEPHLQAQLDRGQRTRVLLRQAEHDLWAPGEQVAVLLALTEGVLDDVPLDGVPAAEAAIRAKARRRCRAVLTGIEAGHPLSTGDRVALTEAATAAVAGLRG